MVMCIVVRFKQRFKERIQQTQLDREAEYEDLTKTGRYEEATEYWRNWHQVHSGEDDLTIGKFFAVLGKLLVMAVLVFAALQVLGVWEWMVGR